MPRIELISSFASLATVAVEWNRIWSLSARRHVFGSYAWAHAWACAYSPAYSLALLLIYKDNHLAGLLPLVRQGHTVEFLGGDHNDYNDLLCEPHNKHDVAEIALQEALRLLSTDDQCVLANLPEDSSIVTHVRQMSPMDRKRLHLSPADFCPRIVFHPGCSSTLAPLLRKKSLRRHECGLRRLGELRFRHVEDRDEIKHHLPLFFQQHKARCAQKGSASLFLDDRSCAFYSLLVKEMDPKEELRFAVLELDGQPIAYHFGFERDRTFLWYKPTFAPELGEFSPGEVMTKRLLEYAFSRGLQVFDFTRGDEAFKLRFANTVDRNYTLHIFPPGVRGEMQHCQTRMKDFLKRQPRTYRALKATRAFLKKGCLTWR